MRTSEFLKDLVLPGFWLFLFLGSFSNDKNKTTGKEKQAKTDTASINRTKSLTSVELSEKAK